LSFDKWGKKELVHLTDKIGSGATPRGGSKVYLKTGIPLIRSQNVYNSVFSEDGLVYIDNKKAKKLDNVTLCENDILLNITGDSVARCTIVPQQYIGGRVNQHVAIIRTDKNYLNPQFLKYFLISPSMQSRMLSLARMGATRAALTKGMIESFEIPTPDLIEQKAIANILSTLDEKIEVNNQINQTLENMAQELFKRWFVDFEFPNEDGEPYKSSGGEMIESELGLIPEDWGINRIGEVCTCYLGGTPSRKNKDYWDGNIPWINSGKVNDFRILEPSEYITKSGLEKSATKMLKRKTVVLAITGATLGQVSLLEIDTCANQSVVGVTGNSIAPYYYIYPYIQNIIKSIIGNQTGGAQQHINKGNIENTKVIIPQQEVLNKFKKVAHVNYQEIAQLSRENMILKEIRDTLLPKLMSGEIRVPLEGLEESLTEVKGG